MSDEDHRYYQGEISKLGLKWTKLKKTIDLDPDLFCNRSHFNLKLNYFAEGYKDQIFSDWMAIPFEIVEEAGSGTGIKS